MICFVEMVNCSTGEMYYSKKLGFAFNIGMPNDAGMRRLRLLLESVIRGSRIKREPLQLRLMFNEPRITDSSSKRKRLIPASLGMPILKAKPNFFE